MADPLDTLLDTIRASARAAMGQLLASNVADLKASLSVPGSPVPFVASAPGSPPTNWYGGLMIDAIHGSLAESGDTLTLTVSSEAIDPYVSVGHHFSEDSEFGHWWDGRAYVPASGSIEQIAPPHEVAPRPFMRPAFENLTAQADAVLPRAMGGGR